MCDGRATDAVFCGTAVDYKRIKNLLNILLKDSKAVPQNTTSVARPSHIRRINYNVRRSCALNSPGVGRCRLGQTSSVYTVPRTVMQNHHPPPKKESHPAPQFKVDPPDTKTSKIRCKCPKLHTPNFELGVGGWDSFFGGGGSVFDCVRPRVLG